MRRPAGMKVKIFMYLAVFSAIVLAVIVVFQIILLEPVYRASTRRQVTAAARTISGFDEGSSDYESDIYDIASRFGLCVSVFAITEDAGGGKTAVETVRAHTGQACVIHSTVTNEGLFAELYTRARQSDRGIYLETPELRNSDS